MAGHEDGSEDEGVQVTDPQQHQQHQQHQQQVEQEETVAGGRVVISKWMHLWNASNTLFSRAPTISRHLGFKLCNEGADQMTAFTKQLLCADCGTLAWTPLSTRVRKRRRVFRGRRNKILSHCPECHAVTAQPGSAVQPREKKERTTKHNKKKKNRGGRRLHQHQQVAAEEGEEVGGKKDEQQQKTSSISPTSPAPSNKPGMRTLKKLKPVADTRRDNARKRKRDGKKSQTPDEKPQATGLAASFLFEDLG